MLNDLQIDLSAVLAGEILSLPIDCAFMPENAQEFGDITLTSPVSVRGQITGQAGYVRMSVEVTADYLAHCARCLDEIRGTLSFPIEKTVAVRGTLADEEADDVVSDYVLIENGILNLAAVVTEQIWLELPYRFLCSDDCKGLCPKCGTNRNKADCGCSLKEADPRLAPLRALLEKKQDK